MKESLFRRQTVTAPPPWQPLWSAPPLSDSQRYNRNHFSTAECKFVNQWLAVCTLEPPLLPPQALGVLNMAINLISLAHNHPSGDPSPSEADAKVTRDLIRVGQLLKIEITDHIMLGRPE